MPIRRSDAFCARWPCGVAVTGSSRPGHPCAEVVNGCRVGDRELEAAGASEARREGAPVGRGLWPAPPTVLGLASGGGRIAVGDCGNIAAAHRGDSGNGSRWAAMGRAIGRQPRAFLMDEPLSTWTPS